MRTNRILACAAIVASLVACNKKNEAVKQDGNTYTSVQLRLAGDNLRAELDQHDNLGTTEESTVNNISLVAKSTYDWANAEINNAEGLREERVLTTTTAKAATAGDNLDMALVVNAIDEFKTNNPEFIYEGAISNVINTTNGFVMTSKKVVNTIKPNISKTEVENIAQQEYASEDKEKNFFNLGHVERVVAKGVVMEAEKAVTEIKDDQGQGIGKVSGLMYAAVNGATKTYALLNHAGKRAMDDTKHQYGIGADAFVSAIDDVNANPAGDVNSFKKAVDAEAAGLVRLSNYLPAGKTANEDIIDYEAIAVSKNLNRTASYPTYDTGKYFYENSADLTKEGNKSFYRLAYAKIYATFTPAKVWKKADNADKLFVAKENYGVFYEENPAKQGQPKGGAKAVNKDGKQDGKQYVEGYFKYTDIVEVPATEGTFYVGVKDQRFYADKVAAASTNITYAAGQKAHTYKDGKMAWRALWNRQMEGAKVINGDARRNNIYVLTINSFTGIGMNYDPSDPSDPNLPNPEKPNDPTAPDNPNNDDPHVENQDTYIAVTATVQPWNVVSRKVDLGNGNDNI